jgi:hypothetical protein
MWTSFWHELKVTLSRHVYNWYNLGNLIRPLLVPMPTPANVQHKSWRRRLKMKSVHSEEASCSVAVSSHSNNTFLSAANYSSLFSSLPFPATYLTIWKRVLEKLTITQLVKKISAFYGTRRFITVFTWARHWSLTWARCIQSTTSTQFP